MKRQNAAPQSTGLPIGARTGKPSRRRDDLLRWTLKLEAEKAALLEDNRQLRAALSIFSEVARHEPEFPVDGLIRVA